MVAHGEERRVRDAQDGGDVRAHFLSRSRSQRQHRRARELLRLQQVKLHLECHCTDRVQEHLLRCSIGLRMQLGSVSRRGSKELGAP